MPRSRRLNCTATGEPREESRGKRNGKQRKRGLFPQERPASLGEKQLARGNGRRTGCRQRGDQKGKKRKSKVVVGGRCAMMSKRRSGTV
eukprot:3054362-Pleurochrysis_carterae.AAC.1